MLRLNIVRLTNTLPGVFLPDSIVERVFHLTDHKHKQLRPRPRCGIVKSAILRHSRTDYLQESMPKRQIVSGGERDRRVCQLLVLQPDGPDQRHELLVLLIAQSGQETIHETGEGVDVRGEQTDGQERGALENSKNNKYGDLVMMGFDRSYFAFIAPK